MSRTEQLNQGGSGLREGLIVVGILVVLALGVAGYLLRAGGSQTPGRPQQTEQDQARPDYAAAIKSAPLSADFVLCAVTDASGNLYVGSEDGGLHRYDVAKKGWHQFTTGNSGIGEDTVTSLLTDKSGRVWAGHLARGVSVFNGETWRNYDVLSGPMGGRIWAMALSPRDGSVWMATDVGLARYTPDTDSWSYYSRVDGLPCDEFSSLAFAPNGTLYAGTHCHGLMIGSANDGYRSWRHVPGMAFMPSKPAGNGLPSNLVNCVLVGSTGTVYAGTSCGLAWSTDQGETWRFVRGMDWRENLEGLYVETPAEGEDHEAILAEDRVTALAEDTDGQLRIGYGRGGQEILDPSVSAVVRDTVAAGRITHFIYTLPGDSGSVAGIYGFGAQWMDAKTRTNAKLEFLDHGVVSHPSPAMPPKAAELRAMLKRVESLPAASRVVGALGEDWDTKGDWICRYGRQRGILCGADNPMDHDYGYGEPYNLIVATGPHRIGTNNGAWSWLQGAQSDNPRWLYDPCVNTRRIGEWNDGSFDTGKYPISWEGPDLWLQVDLPAGVHRVSLYFLNKDGHNDQNQHRDYLIQVREYTPELEDAVHLPVLAQTRVRDFWNGVYKQLVLSKGKYWIKVERNGSHVTILSGVFFDRLVGEAGPSDRLPRMGMGSIMYGPPNVDEAVLRGPDPMSSDIITAAAELVRSLDRAYALTDGVVYQRPYRVQALRAARAAGARPEVLANWRWAIPLWAEGERQEFSAKMAEAQASLAGKLGALESQVTKRRRRPGQ